jgi:uncharacterized protein YbjT (DUF2867 family)
MMRAVLVVALSAGVPFVSSLRVVPTRTMDRRSALSLAGAAATFGTLHPLAAHAAGKGKIVVFGGSGYVGAYASQMLVSQGYDVISVSRKSPSDAADKVKAILGTSLKVDYQQLDAGKEDLTAVLKGASGVISCVGVAPGGGPDQKNGNGAVNVAIADASKAAGIERFVYLGLADELANGPIKFVFGDYVKGKAIATAAVAKDYGPAALIIKPGIIAGGPPGEVRPPGPPGMTPVPVEAVARAAVAGALGKQSGTIDGNAAIAAAGAQ